MELHGGAKVKQGACVKYKGETSIPTSLPKLLSEWRPAEPQCILSVPQSTILMGLVLSMTCPVFFPRST